MNNFEIKKRILLNGESKIYKNWKETATESSGYELTEKEFLDSLEWVCGDPCDGGKSGNRLTREIGLTNNGIVRIKRFYGVEDFCTMYLVDENSEHGAWGTWDGDTFYMVPRTEKERMFADENGRLPQPRKISLSARDRI